MRIFFDRFEYKIGYLDAKIKRFLRITRFRGLFGHRRAFGHSQFKDQNVVYLYLIFDLWFPCHHLHGLGILERHETLYIIRKEKSPKILDSNTLGDSIFKRVALYEN
jgi:hypothetical protein